jgi:hypothetical protein
VRRAQLTGAYREGLRLKPNTAVSRGTGWGAVQVGIRLRYRGGARIGDRDAAGALVREITEDITGLSITDDTGRTYRVPAANVPGTCRPGTRAAASSGSGLRWARRLGSSG